MAMMKTCGCLYCLAEKSGREFREFANTWVRDNIHYRKPKENLTEIKSIPEKWRSKYATKFEGANHKPIELRHQEWDERTTSIVLDREARAEAEKELGRRYVDLATRHPSPTDEGTKKNGCKCVTYREHEMCVTWKPKSASRPPTKEGAFSSWQMSPKTRRRVTNAGKWLTLKHPHGCFITLTYDRAICDTEAKRHLDNWLKRLRRSQYSSPGVLWVAERTQRHWIHFHVIVGGFVDKDWIQSAWRAVTGLELFTNVKPVTKYTAPYVVKYAGKNDRAYIFGRRWGQSEYVAQGCKPRWRGEQTECDWDEFLHDSGVQDLDPKRVTFLRSGYLYEFKVQPCEKKWIPEVKKSQ